MQITVIDVGTPNTHAAKNGRSYQSLEVTYKGVDGKVGNKKLMSFTNPTVFKAAQEWSKGTVVDVTTQKDDQGYWQWTAIGGEVMAQEAPSKPAAAGVNRTTGSNYETKEERAARQVYIVRQSSISAAVSTLTVGAKSAPSADSIIELAKQFEAYVFAKEEPQRSTSPSLDFDDIQDDVIL